MAFLKFLFFVGLELANLGPTIGIPQLQRLVKTAGDDLLAVGTPGNAIDGGYLWRGVRVDLSHLGPLHNVPDSERSVMTPCGQQSTSGIEGDGVNIVPMSQTLRCIRSKPPTFDGLIRAGRVEGRVVAGEENIQRRPGVRIGLARFTKIWRQGLSWVKCHIPRHD